MVLDPSTLKPNFTLTLDDVRDLPPDILFQLNGIFPQHYVFRNPFISSICPILASPDETLSLLQEISSSRSIHKRLPIEILLHINDFVHQSSDLLKTIRSKWSPFLLEYDNIDSEDDHYEFELYHAELPSLCFPIRLDRAAKRYYASAHGTIQHGTMFEDLFTQISSADLLYRLRCFFPEVVIDTETVRGFKVVWKAILNHEETGMYAEFTEDRGGAKIRMYYADEGLYSICDDSGWASENHVLRPFINDFVGLMDAFCQTIDGGRRLAHYHPAAVADFPTDDEHYIAVAERINSFPRTQDRYIHVYKKWQFANISTPDVSPFPSLLHDLKYNIESRKIDRAMGTASVTTVISSALLFYRLICKFLKRRRNDDVGQTPPTSSVWQIRLVHRKVGKHIIFMDSFGSFDIRVESGSDSDSDSEEMRNDIDALVEALCSDTCTHPYNGVVAGCVA